MLLRRGCTWLTLMPLLLSLSIGELSFYRDALPETSEVIALKHLARYLEAHRLQQRLHRSHLATFLSPMHKKHSNLQQLNHQEERRGIVEFIPDRKAAEDILNRKLKAWLERYYHSPHYHDSLVNQITSQDSGYSGYLYNLDNKYPDYPEEKQPDETNNGGHFPKDLEYGRPFDADRGEAMERPIVNTFHKYIDHNPAGIFLHHEGGRETARPASATAEATEPEFTYRFDNSNLEEKHPFAMAPNDPRYYNDAPFSSDDQQDVLGTNWQEEEADKEPILIKHEDNLRNINQKTPKELVVRLDASEQTDKPKGPFMVPMNHDLNNDIYFIAIVAGCSAAAMFALVLISLTWCRLRRGAKAAADIEYPAYGVTGPNKDVSPSGDQRLAQSAQMYHFQHQKQQIIAMENRTSATRDPGSLSEAESDEENEEGDYTVYECPGLASTGEMEVKNPMFHDDPTPATPAAQSNNKEEDHI